MIKYDNLLGREFVHGDQDCYALVRDFYQQNFDIDLPNYARPEDWWNTEMDMYRDRFIGNNFRVLNCHPSEYQLGDVFLMAIRSKVANHAGILVENGDILHHLYGQTSVVSPYRDVFRNTTVMVVRHNEVVIDQQAEEIDFRSLLSPATQRKLDEFVANATPEA